MKKLLLVVCMISLFALVGWTSYGQRQSAPRTSWEYMVKQDGALSLPTVNLTALGAEGWELTAITTREVYVGESHYQEKTYYLKRQK